jgi:hypothetical protein
VSLNATGVTAEQGCTAAIFNRCQLLSYGFIGTEELMAAFAPVQHKPRQSVQRTEMPGEATQLHADLHARPQVRATMALQRRLNATVQRRPIQIGASKMYYDSVYPGFKIIKIDGDHYRGASGMDAGKDIYYSGEESEYAYDEDFEHMVLMRNYAPATNPDHFNSNGGNLVPIDAVTAGRTSASLNTARLSNALQGMDEGAVLPPIRIDAAGNVIDGNHRLEAAKAKGHTHVPALTV